MSLLFGVFDWWFAQVHADDGPFPPVVTLEQFVEEFERVVVSSDSQLGVVYTFS